MGAEQEARPRPLLLSAMTAAASHLPPRSRVPGQQSKKTNRQGHLSVRRKLLFLGFRDGASSRLPSSPPNAKGKANSGLFGVERIPIPTHRLPGEFEDAIRKTIALFVRSF